MKRGAIWIVLTCVIVVSLVLASCAASTSTSNPTSTTTSTVISNPRSTTSSTAASTPVTRTTTTTTTSSTGNWWDKLGKPQYGGSITMQIGRDFQFFDPYQGETLVGAFFGWTEQLFNTNWTIDPSIISYQLSFADNSYMSGGLVESWEFTSPGVYVLHVRHGIHWQNIPPANGREFTADDIVFHFDRMLGLGYGFTKAAPYWGTVAWTKSLVSISATDKYTVVMNWNTTNPEFVNENLEAPGASTSIENPEAVKQWGDVIDWHHAIGTGAFMLTDFVSGSSMTLIKNPDYWGYDERYPQNKLPYVDKINYLVMPDSSTALAAMRTGKIDILDSLQLSQAQTMQKTNPEILQIPTPLGSGLTLDPRDDLAPFSDIRIRKALQMAIDLTTIAKTYYGGTADPSPLALTTKYMTGWGWPYEQWPQALKDEYAYNPTAAKQLLAAAGFPSGFKTDLVVDNQVDLNLLQIVKSYFSAIGVDMDIRPMDSAAFNAFVTTSHKNDALCQRSTGTLGLASYPLRQFLRLQTGQSADVAMVSDPVFDAFYNQALAATSVDQVKQILINANKEVVQQHFIISLLQPTVYNLCQPWLKGYNGQYGAASGTAGPIFLWFYESRFWIDQNVKKSPGH